MNLAKILAGTTAAIGAGMMAGAINYAYTNTSKTHVPHMQPMHLSTSVFLPMSQSYAAPLSPMHMIAKALTPIKKEYNQWAFVSVLCLGYLIGAGGALSLAALHYNEKKPSIPNP
jgi:hypothetical protein